MASSQHVLLQNDESLIEELSSLLSKWELHGPVDIRCWPQENIFCPDLIGDLVCRAHNYEIFLKHKVKELQKIMKLFLQQGKKLCKAHAKSLAQGNILPAVPSGEVQTSDSSSPSSDDTVTVEQLRDIDSSGSPPSEYMPTPLTRPMDTVTWPENFNPDDVFFSPLGTTEHPRTFLHRAYQAWADVVGCHPSRVDDNGLHKSLLRTRIAQGLPDEVRNELNKEISLSCTSLAVFMDIVSHHVDSFRKKVDVQRRKDAESVRQLVQLQLQRLQQINAMAIESPPTPQNNRYPPVALQCFSDRASPRSAPGKPPSHYSGCYKCGSKEHFARRCPDYGGIPVPPRETLQQVRLTGPSMLHLSRCCDRPGPSFAPFQQQGSPASVRRQGPVPTQPQRGALNSPLPFRPQWPETSRHPQ